MSGGKSRRCCAVSLQIRLPGPRNLARQIAAYQAALDERRQVKALLRRQLADQVARSEDLVSGRSSQHAAGAD